MGVTDALKSYLSWVKDGTKETFGYIKDLLTVHKTLKFIDKLYRISFIITMLGVLIAITTKPYEVMTMILKHLSIYTTLSFFIYITAVYPKKNENSNNLKLLIIAVGAFIFFSLIIMMYIWHDIYSEYAIFFGRTLILLGMIIASLLLINEAINATKEFHKNILVKGLFILITSIVTTFSLIKSYNIINELFFISPLFMAFTISILFMAQVLFITAMALSLLSYTSIFVIIIISPKFATKAPLNKRKALRLIALFLTTLLSVLLMALSSSSEKYLYYDIGDLIKKFALYADFNHHHHCQGLQGKPVVFLDDGYVLTTKPDDDSFEVKKCIYEN